MAKRVTIMVPPTSYTDLEDGSGRQSTIDTRPSAHFLDVPSRASEYFSRQSMEFMMAARARASRLSTRQFVLRDRARDRQSIAFNVAPEIQALEDPWHKFYRHLYVHFDMLCAHIFIVTQILVLYLWWSKTSPSLSLAISWYSAMIYTVYTLFALLVLETSWFAVIAIAIYAVGAYYFAIGVFLEGCILYIIGSAQYIWMSPWECTFDNALFWGSWAFLIGSITFLFNTLCVDYVSIGESAFCTPKAYFPLSSWYTCFGYFCFILGRFYFASTSWISYFKMLDEDKLEDGELDMLAKFVVENGSHPVVKKLSILETGDEQGLTTKEIVEALRVETAKSKDHYSFSESGSSYSSEEPDQSEQEESKSDVEDCMTPEVWQMMAQSVTFRGDSTSESPERETTPEIGGGGGSAGSMNVSFQLPSKQPVRSSIVKSVTKMMSNLTSGRRSSGPLNNERISKILSTTISPQLLAKINARKNTLATTTKKAFIGTPV